VIDPFGPLGEQAAARGMVFDYPAIEQQSADLLLITHEHADHSAAEVVTGEPVVVRSKAGTYESPLGEVVAVASEHDDVAGTKRGPNVIVVFTLDGLRICHFGDFGQRALRPEQREAIGEVDVLFLPAGGGPTIGGADAADVVRALAPRLVVPMHYRTPAVNFLDPPDAFLDALDAEVRRLETSEATAEDVLGTSDAPVVALLAAPA
jgi:L-ascorbate metabolism protein UlaG (beta-lactamase superfamily)